MPGPRRPKRRRIKLDVAWTDFALRNLEQIDSYIAQDNPVAAERWVQKLIATGESAASAPMAGRVVPEKQRADIREVLVRHYRIVYRIRETRIDILTVFEGHKLLREEALVGKDDG